MRLNIVMIPGIGMGVHELQGYQATPHLDTVLKIRPLQTWTVYPKNGQSPDITETNNAIERNRQYRHKDKSLSNGYGNIKTSQRQLYHSEPCPIYGQANF